MKKVFFVLIVIYITTIFANIERRAVIDIGSGTTKITVADVNTNTQKIDLILYNDSFEVPYQKSLESSNDHTIDQKTLNRGIHTFRLIKNIANIFEVEKIHAVATAAFRNANNQHFVVDQIRYKTGLNIEIISQKDEALLGLYSAFSDKERYQSVDEAVIWDFGTGSFQIATLSKTTAEKIEIFQGDFGSMTFLRKIIKEVQNQDPNTSQLAFLSKEDIEQALHLAASEALKIKREIKLKMQQPNNIILGIGRLFTVSLKSITGSDVLTQTDLKNYLQSIIGSDLSDPFADLDASNALLILGFMQALDIEQIFISESQSTHGMLTYPTYFP